MRVFSVVPSRSRSPRCTVVTIAPIAQQLFAPPSPPSSARVCALLSFRSVLCCLLVHHAPHGCPLHRRRRVEKPWSRRVRGSRMNVTCTRSNDTPRLRVHNLVLLHLAHASTSNTAAPLPRPSLPGNLAMETVTTTSIPKPRTHVASAYPTTTTRAMPRVEPDQQAPQLSAPASQESFISLQSIGSSIAPPRLQASDSNLSQLTSYTDTDNTSPTSSAGDKSGPDASRPVNKSHVQRDRTPEENNHVHYRNGESALASPMSITSPIATNGAKRTASGHVKNAPSLSSTQYDSALPGRESRRESVSSTGSRAGELAASLKTRLGYAMAKVQHGWEHKSLHEVEQLTAHRARSNRYSMSHVDQQRPGTSGLSNGTARLSMYDQYARGAFDVSGAPPSKRHSGTYAAYAYPAQPPPTSYAAHPRLQPAPDIRPTSNSRSYPTAPTAFLPTYPNGMSPPQTPVHTVPRRPTTIRTETQTKDAEMEALQALIGLGSPHTSQLPVFSPRSPNRMPLDTPRRVAFARSGSDSSSSSSIPGPSQMSSQPEQLDVR